MKPANENITRIIQPELSVGALIPHESAVYNNKPHYPHHDVIIKDFRDRRPLQSGTGTGAK